MTAKRDKIIIYTDGSSRGNPGPGGWGAIVAYNNSESKVESKKSKVVELGGGEKHTTNNRMELMAAIQSLLYVRDMGNEYTIDMRVDSRYVINGITKWVVGWQKNGWMNSKKEEVLNRDLWEELICVVSDIQMSGATIAWNYTPGHAGIPGNDRADKVATIFADGKKAELFDGARSAYGIDLAIYAGDAKKLFAKKSRSKSSAKVYSYVSLVGGKFMKHPSWAECEKRVKGAKGAKFKKAFSANDEQSIAKEWGARDVP